MISLSIIIVNFNTKELLVQCLRSIQKAESDKLEWEIIVIDNNSQDGSVEEIKNIRTIFNDQNLGFAKANNQGIKIATGDYVLLLNSDTQVKAGALEQMFEFTTQHPEAGVIGARLLNQDGSVQPSVFHLPKITNALKEYWLGIKGSYGKYFPVGENPKEVEAVVGAAMLIPKTVIEKVGLLDERYFMYFEDLDYCRRIRRAGFKVYYLSKAEIYHYHGASGKNLGSKTNQWLVESSKIYNGIVKYYILTIIILIGLKIYRK